MKSLKKSCLLALTLTGLFVGSLSAFAGDLPSCGLHSKDKFVEKTDLAKKLSDFDKSIEYCTKRNATAEEIQQYVDAKAQCTKSNCDVYKQLFPWCGYTPTACDKKTGYHSMKVALDNAAAACKDIDPKSSQRLKGWADGACASAQNNIISGTHGNIHGTKCDGEYVAFVDSDTHVCSIHAHELLNDSPNYSVAKQPD